LRIGCHDSQLCSGFLGLCVEPGATPRGCFLAENADALDLRAARPEKITVMLPALRQENGAERVDSRLISALRRIALSKVGRARTTVFMTCRGVELDVD
jgi:hypothetical protein